MSMDKHACGGMGSHPSPGECPSLLGGEFFHPLLGKTPLRWFSSRVVNQRLAKAMGQRGPEGFGKDIGQLSFGPNMVEHNGLVANLFA